nr:hypothetical protein GCM10020093_103880 [Planobispora longispora]
MEKEVFNPSTGPDGLLFDPETRTAMARFVGGEETLDLEAAAAVRIAFHAIERIRAHGARGRG